MTWWQEPLESIIPAGFKYDKPAQVGGAHDKHFFISKKNGKKYLWKSGKRKVGAVAKSGKARSKMSRDREYTIPNAEYFAARAAHAVLEPGEHIPLAKLEFPFDGVEGVEKGTIGVIMPFVDDATPNKFQDDFTDSLAPEDIKAIQRLHIFDYLVSNLDTHAETTLRVGGKLIGIDRGQAMRYLSGVLRSMVPGMDSDTLERTKTPVGAKSFYTEFFNKVREGKIDAPFSNVEDILKKIEGISDETWREWMTDYLEAFKNKYLVAMKSQPTGKPGNKTYWKGLSPKEIDQDIDGIANEMVKRKNRIRADVVKFYKGLHQSIQEATGRSFGITEKSLRLMVDDVVDRAVAHIFQKVDADWTTDVTNSDDADALFEASLQSKQFSKALYYKAVSKGLDSIIRGESLSQEDMMKCVTLVASRWKSDAEEIVNDLNSDNLKHMEYAQLTTIYEGLEDAYKQGEMAWIIVYKAAYQLKKESVRITG